ncbi:MAG: ABC transporter substrate-binding protein [Bryobacterales bacterium]|nr:ABC transporter substrate-binding protein [Bryobacterales bacterium]
MKALRALVVLLIALQVVSCGGSGNGPVRMALVANSHTHLAVPLAEKLGFYQQEGVDVVIESLPSTQKTTEALLAGSAEMATGGYDHLLQLVASGRALRSVVVNTIRDNRSIFASPLRKDIRSLRDLRSRNVGVPGLGSSNHLFVLHALALHGLRSDDASFAGVGVGATLIHALERGVVDAAVASLFDGVLLQRRNPGIAVLVDASTPDGAKALWQSESAPFAVVFAKTEWIEANRDKVARIARADRQALAWLRTHSAEELLAILPAGYQTADKETDLAGLRAIQPLYSPDGRMPRAGAEALLAALARTQDSFRNAKIDVAATYTDEFILEKP